MENYVYELGEATVTKHVECWKLIVPLHDSDGKDFDPLLIDSITGSIVKSFPGLTAINCVGHWRGDEQIYADRNLELIIDVASTDSAATERFFAKYKSDLALHLGQSKIYLTREQSKTEVLSYDEFFKEVGLEIALGATDSEKNRIARSAISNASFLLSRMAYETTMLRRDSARGVILWERQICGLRLQSEHVDDHPGSRLVAADRIDHYVEWLKQPSDVVVIGDWEFQKFALTGRPFTPLVEANVPTGIEFKLREYLSQRGEPISHKHFIEEFTMNILCSVMALRDEGFLPHEIAVSVGSDGSLQWTTDEGARRVVFHCPAPIPDVPIQREILRCVGIAIDALFQDELSLLGVQQAKALHRYVFKRAVVRLVLQQKPR